MNFEDVRDTLLTDRVSHPITTHLGNNTFNQTAYRIPTTAPQTGGTPNGEYRDRVPGPFNSDWESISSSGTTPENQIVFGEGGDFVHWLASRSFSASSPLVGFDVGVVFAGIARSGSGGWDTFWSNASSSTENTLPPVGVRPVITLSRNIQWAENTEGTNNNPHIINHP